MDPEGEQPFSRKRIPRDSGPETNPYYRLALTIVCLLGAGCVIVGGMSLAAYWFKSRHDHTNLNLLRCLYLSIPLLIGLALLIRSPALARRIEQMLED